MVVDIEEVKVGEVRTGQGISVHHHGLDFVEEMHHLLFLVALVDPKELVDKEKDLRTLTFQ